MRELTKNTKNHSQTCNHTWQSRVWGDYSGSDFATSINTCWPQHKSDHHNPDVQSPVHRDEPPLCPRWGWLWCDLSAERSQWFCELRWEYQNGLQNVSKMGRFNVKWPVECIQSNPFATPLATCWTPVQWPIWSLFWQHLLLVNNAHVDSSCEGRSMMKCCIQTKCSSPDGILGGSWNVLLFQAPLIWIGASDIDLTSAMMNWTYEWGLCELHRIKWSDRRTIHAGYNSLWLQPCKHWNQ